MTFKLDTPRLANQGIIQL